MKKQYGFSLVEIMISMAIGLIVISGALTIYVATVSSSTATLKTSKLNQELSALLNVMANDIRRAGYWNGADTDPTNPQNNPFAAFDNTALEVIDNMTNNIQMAANSIPGGQCILYAYDLNDDDNLDNEDISGFRLNNGVVQMRQRGDILNNVDDHDNCNNANDIWLDLTDGNLITIGNLIFRLGDSECLNTTEPNGLDDDADGTVDNAEEADCYVRVPANGSGDVTVETRQVSISVTGFLNNDANTTLTLNEDARVRNDLVRVR